MLIPALLLSIRQPTKRVKGRSFSWFFPPRSPCSQEATVSCWEFRKQSERIRGEWVTVVAKPGIRIQKRSCLILLNVPKIVGGGSDLANRATERRSLLKHQQTHASLDSPGRNYDRTEQKAQSPGKAVLARGQICSGTRGHGRGIKANIPFTEAHSAR